LGRDAWGSDESVCFQHVSTSLMKLIYIKATFWGFDDPSGNQAVQCIFFLQSQ
jgi:hypothetical protein